MILDSIQYSPESKPIYIGCDDSGHESKLLIFEHLSSIGISFVDCGSDGAPSRYPYFAAKVASAISSGKADKGILICGSGVGMSIAANKFKGVRAAVVSDSYTARLTRRHNDSNILCLGGELLGNWALLNIVDIWLNTDYDAGHHEGSLALICEMEDHMLSDALWCPEEIPYSPFEWNPQQSL